MLIEPSSQFPEAEAKPYQNYQKKRETPPNKPFSRAKHVP